MKYLKFSDGDEMPMLGLGTFQIASDEVYKVIRTAINIGYRHFDCAAAYGNEKEIGNALSDAIKDGEVNREELWITSKLWNSCHLIKDVVPSLQKSLDDLQFDYLDLYLIHWPVAFKPGIAFPSQKEDYLTEQEAPLIDTWTGIEECLDEELTKHIGVSNCNIGVLKKLQAEGTLEPEVNQVELHPYLPQQGLYDYCRLNNIHLTAYAPLGATGRPDRVRKDRDPHLLSEHLIVEIAEKHQCSPAQVLIAWGLSRKTAVIPKSTNPGRMKENFEAQNIRLDREDLRKLIILPKHRFFDGSIFTTNGSPYKLTDLWEY